MMQTILECIEGVNEIADTWTLEPMPDDIESWPVALMVSRYVYKLWEIELKARRFPHVPPGHSHDPRHYYRMPLKQFAAKIGQMATRSKCERRDDANDRRLVATGIRLPNATGRATG